MPNFNTTLQARRLTINYLNGQSGSSSLSEGDVVVIDSSDPTKVKLTTSENDQNIVGVITGSTTDEGEMTFVATMGVATIKVTGSVSINDYLITSTTAGRAKSATSGRVIGKAVTTNASGNGTVSAIILSGAAVGSVTDHATLNNLASGDDHTQYALLAGRSGGQALIGGTGSGDDLTLQSTAHATKGNIHFGSNSTYDQVNDRLGIKQTFPYTDICIGDGVPSPDPFGSIAAGLSIITTGFEALISISATGASSITLSDTGGSSNGYKIVQLISSNDSTYFRFLDETDYSTAVKAVLSMRHTDGQVAIAPGTADEVYSFKNDVVFEVNSTSKAVMLPKLDNIAEGNISTPIAGMLYYNTDDNEYKFYNGSAWISLVTGS